TLASPATGPMTFEPVVIVGDRDFQITWAPGAAPLSDVNLAWTPATPRADVSVSAVILVGPIPISVTAGLAGPAGLDVDLPVRTNRNCTSSGVDFVRASGGFEPWADLDGYAAVDIGISGVASAGIGMQLKLLELHLPLTATAGLH